MQYRTFPKAPGLTVSTLGFGCGRLPTLPGDPSRVDEAAATRLLHDAIAAGVNYLDTAWSHHQGQAEPFLGRVLRGGLRDRVCLATKLPPRLVEREGDWERRLDAQLERLATDHVDCYLLQSLTREDWAHARRLGAPQALERAKADGRVDLVGFSFEGRFQEFEELIDGHEWDLCQLPLDFLHHRQQAGLNGLCRAAERGVGVVVVEPLRGGALARPPPVVAEAWAGAEQPWSPAEWALRWVWDQAAVVTVVSGTRTSDHLRENVRAAATAGPLAAQELERIEVVRRAYRTRRRVPCTACGGCGVCANKIPVPDLFSLYNDAMFGSKADAVEEYRQSFLARGAGADQCIACGVCLPMCGKGIPIPKRLREAHLYLGGP